MRKIMAIVIAALCGACESKVTVDKPTQVELIRTVPERPDGSAATASAATGPTPEGRPLPENYLRYVERGDKGLVPQLKTYVQVCVVGVNQERQCSLMEIYKNVLLEEPQFVVSSQQPDQPKRDKPRNDKKRDKKPRAELIGMIKQGDKLLSERIDELIRRVDEGFRKVMQQKAGAQPPPRRSPQRQRVPDEMPKRRTIEVEPGARGK